MSPFFPTLCSFSPLSSSDQEQLTVGVTFDQANYIVAEDTSITVTGRLTGLTGELQTDFSLTLSVDFSVDTFTGKPP